MPIGWIENSTLRTLQTIVGQLAQRDISAPYMVSLSFVDVQGYRLLTNHFMSHRAPVRYPEPMLILPDVMIESMDSFRSWEVMRPVFDTLWNAFEYDGSPNYDEQGNWSMQ